MESDEALALHGVDQGKVPLLKDLRASIVALAQKQSVVVLADQTFEDWLVSLDLGLLAQLCKSYSMYVVTKQVWSAMVCSVTGKSPGLRSFRVRLPRVNLAVRKRMTTTVLTKVQATKAFQAWRTRKIVEAGEHRLSKLLFCSSFLA